MQDKLQNRNSYMKIVILKCGLKSPSSLLKMVLKEPVFNFVVKLALAFAAGQPLLLVSALTSGVMFVFCS